MMDRDEVTRRLILIRDHVEIALRSTFKGAMVPLGMARLELTNLIAAIGLDDPKDGDEGDG